LLVVFSPIFRWIRRNNRYLTGKRPLKGPDADELVFDQLLDVVQGLGSVVPFGEKIDFHSAWDAQGEERQKAFAVGPMGPASDPDLAVVFGGGSHQFRGRPHMEAELVVQVNDRLADQGASLLPGFTA
jgi:hypothetical protein